MEIWIGALCFVVFGVALAIVKSYRHAFVVFQGYAGLLFRDGRLIENLAPGLHVRWGWRYEVRSVDMRLQTFVVQGQEVLSSDGAPIRVAVIAWVAVANAEVSFTQTEGFQTPLYQAVQVAARQAISSKTLDEVVNARESLATEMRATLEGVCERFGIRIDEMFVRDLTLGGGVKSAYTDALKAQLEAKAMLEKARAETGKRCEVASGQPRVASIAGYSGGIGKRRNPCPRTERHLPERADAIGHRILLPNTTPVPTEPIRGAAGTTRFEVLLRRAGSQLNAPNH